MPLRIFLLLVLWTGGAALGAAFKINGRTFTVPDGFVLDLAAGSPLVQRPITAAFDERGRLYVTDSSGTNEALEKQLVNRPHRVVRLDPADPAGHFVAGAVFADHLTFPEGALWLRGSLYVSGVPSIWKLTAPDATAAADRREEWFQGKTMTHCGNDLHGPFAGPDGWIYWCKGAFAEQRLTLGNGREFVTRAAHIFRSRPDGQGLEPVLTGGMDNPVGVAFTPEGERILSGTFFQNPANGRRDGLIHALYGGVYGKPNDVLEGHPRTGDLLPVMTHLGPAAACGLVRYASGTFGPEFRDNLFVACFNLHKITRHVLVPSGATYETRDRDFLTCDDPDFHPTDVVEDADGSLLIVDTGGWYKICCPTSQLSKPDVLGAIYRVRRADAPTVADPRGLDLAWEKMNAEQAAPLLGDPRPTVAAQAIARLAALGANSVPALVQTLRAPTFESRRNAVWALTQIDDPSARTAVRSALDDANESVRHTAAASASLWRDAAAKDRLVAWLDGQSPALQRIAAEALGRTGDKSAAAPLFARIASGNYDRALEHSLIYALIDLADRDTAAAALHSPNPRVQRAALLALDQMQAGGVPLEQVTALLDSPDPALRQSAWFVAGRHQEWSGALAGFLGRRLAAAGASAAEHTELLRMLAQFAIAPTVQDMLAATLRDASLPKPARLGALQAIARAPVKAPPSAWLDAVSQALASSDPEFTGEAIAAARSLTLPRERIAEFTAALAHVGRDSQLPAETRLAALSALPGNLPAIDAELLRFLRTQLSLGHPPMTRAAAASALAKATLSADQLLGLTPDLEHAGPLEINRLLPLFVSSADDSISRAALTALDRNKSVEGLRPDIVRDWLAKSPPSVQQQGQALLVRLGIDPVQQKAHLDELAATLEKGDVRRGQTVFNSPKAGCTICHAIGYLGGNFGPDLTSVGTVRTARDLLESIIYPSASFVRSYEPFVVVTRGGAEQSGLLRKDASDEIVLATAPGSEVHIPRDQVVELRPGTVSLMPAGFEQILSHQELADLLAFLKAGRW